MLATSLAVLTALLVVLPVSNAGGSPDKTPLSTPHNLRVLSATQTSLDLSWNAPADGVAVEGYKVSLEQPTGTKPLEHQLSVRTTEAHFIATQLACGQSYEIEVAAYDRTNNLSEALTSVVATASCVDSRPPSAPTGLQQTTASGTSATLAWSPSTDNVDVAGYSLSQAGFELGTTSDTNYSFAGLSCNKSHIVAVRAYDAARNYSPWVSFYVTTDACGDVSPPTVPTGLVQTNATTSGMSVAWSPSSDNVGVARYALFRDGLLAGATRGVSYSFSGLTCGESYTVGVDAVDGAGNRSARTNATMSTAPCVTPPPTTDTKPPTTPTSLSLVDALPISMTLTWSPSTDNVGVTGYGMFHDGALVQVVTGTTFVYQGLSCGTSHELGVHAYDAKGNHSPIASVIASTTPCSDTSPPTTPTSPILFGSTSSSATVLWSPSTDNVGVAGYGAYVDGQLAGSTVGQTYTFTGLACNKSFVLGIDAYDAAGNRSGRVNVASATTTCDDSQAPTAPSQLTASNPTQTGLALKWTASSDNTGVAGYDVFVNGVKTVTVAGATEYTLSNLTCATTYQLGVEAFDAAGNRSGRPTVSGTSAQCSAPPPPSGSASVFLSPGGNDSGTCSLAAPCRSFNRAYAVAQPGTIVLVQSGTYPSQIINYVAGRDSAIPVVFVPSQGVTIQGDLSILASSIWIKGQASGSIADWRSRTFPMSVTGLTTVLGQTSSRYPRNVTIEGIDTGNLSTMSSDNTVVRDVDVGPAMLDYNGRCSREENRIGANGDAIPKEPTNVIWERVAIHDQNRTLAANNAGCHYGGLFMVSGDGITIRNSIFEQNVVYNVQVQNFGGGSQPSNVRFENNWFGCPVENAYAPNGVNTCDGQASIQFNSPLLSSNWVIRYNSFARASASWGDGGRSPFSNVRFVGNTGLRPRDDVCAKAGVSFARNAWTDGKCSATDRQIATPFVSDSVGAEDLRLVAGSGAVDAGDPSDTPNTDIEGQGRPLGSAPDAGADERG